MSGWRWWLACGLLAATVAEAHPILQNPMWVEVAPDALKVKIFVSVRELNVVQGLPIAADGSVDAALAAETAPRHSGYVLDHLDFRADGVALSGRVTGIEPPKETGKGPEGPDRAHFVFRLEYLLTPPPAGITLSHTMVKEFPSAPGVPWDLSYTYRFGPPGATPVEFGSITRGVEVFYQTGFAQPAGTVPVAVPPPPRWPLLAGVGLLGAALGLGAGNGRDRLRLVVAAGLLFFAGWKMGELGGVKMPAFLATALGGIGVLLVSVDNIHRPLAPCGIRRWVMALVFPAAAGLAAWSMAAVLNTPDAGLPGQCFSLLTGLAFIASALAQQSAKRPVPKGTEAKPPWIQLASLLICAGGLVVLLEGVGIRPWAYWLNRLTS